MVRISGRGEENQKGSLHSGNSMFVVVLNWALRKVSGAGFATDSTAHMDPPPTATQLAKLWTFSGFVKSNGDA